MFVKVIIIIASLNYILVVPYLEISATHLFNPAWTQHALLHEVWQLGTNASLALFSLWLGISRAKWHIAATINLLITLSFSMAYIFRANYGGSTRYADGSELLINGINPAPVIMLLLTVALISVVFRTRKKFNKSDI
jgi:hypothetical protein